MEKYLAAILLSVSSAFSMAAEKVNMAVVCDKTDTMFNKLKDEFGEEVVLYSSVPSENNLSEIITSVWVNKQDGTMSVVKSYVKDKFSCLVAAGENLKIKVDNFGL